MELLPPGRKTLLLNGITHLLHDLQIEMQIVQGIQTRAGNFIGTLQMMQVATREMLASMAGAAGVQRAGVIAVAGIAYLDVAVTGKQPAIARIAGRHHAVEHVHTLADPFHQRSEERRVGEECTSRWGMRLSIS